MTTVCPGCRKLVAREHRFCPHCGVAIPAVATTLPPHLAQAPGYSNAQWIAGAGVLFVGVLLIGMCSADTDSARSGSSTEAVAAVDSARAVVVKTPENSKAKYMEQVERELNSLKTFDGSAFRETKEAVQMGPVLFGVWAMLLDKAKEHELSAGEKARVADLRRGVAAIQARELPLMRAAWGKILREALWKHNLEVRVGGQANRTLRLTAGIFSSNGNIKQIHETLREQALLLRFRRVEYRWYNGQDEYTYFTVESPPDGAIRLITENGLVPAD